VEKQKKPAEAGFFDASGTLMLPEGNRISPCASHR
jgi:hypothetical protein